jgi:hypothetical protein
LHGGDALWTGRSKVDKRRFERTDKEYLLIIANVGSIG